MNPTVEFWLKTHSKGDLHECSWKEILAAYTEAGLSCLLADYHLGQLVKKVQKKEKP